MYKTLNKMEIIDNDVQIIMSLDDHESRPR